MLVYPNLDDADLPFLNHIEYSLGSQLLVLVLMIRRDLTLELIELAKLHIFHEQKELPWDKNICKNAKIFIVIYQVQYYLRSEKKDISITYLPLKWSDSFFVNGGSKSSTVLLVQ